MMIPYRTKAAMKILMGLTREEALEFLRIVNNVQKRFDTDAWSTFFDGTPKEDAVMHMRGAINDGALNIPTHLRGHLERFLGLMIDERVPMDRLTEEYCNAFNPVWQYDLLKLDAPEDPIEEPDTPLPGTASDGEDAGPDKEDERLTTLKDITDKIVKDLVELGLTPYEAFYVIENVQKMLKSGREMYSGQVDTIPIKELKRMREERGGIQ